MNNRSELLADTVGSTKSADISADLFSEWGMAAKKLRPDDEPLKRYTLTALMVAEDVTSAGFQFAEST